MVIYNGLLSLALYDVKKNDILLHEYQELPLPDGVFYQSVIYNSILLRQHIGNFTENIQNIDSIVYVCDVEVKKNPPMSYYGACIQFLILSYVCRLSFLTLIPIKKINYKKIINHEHSTLHDLSLAAIQYAIKEL